jgi:autotransporter-associated beta strand protein
MRRSRVVALLSASALAAVAQFAVADQALFTTQADWGGSTYAPNPPPGSQPQQNSWLGMGWYNQTTVLPYTAGLFSNLEYTTYSTDSATTNGLANFDNLYQTSSQVGTSWAGLSSPSGSLTIENYQGGYDDIESGEMAPSGAQNTAFLTALAKGTVIAIDYTSPLGGTTLTANTNGGSFSDYYNLGFGNFGPSGDTMTATQAASSDQFPTKRGTNPYGVTVGSFVVNNGSYFTAYIPYNGAPIANIIGNSSAYMQFYMYVNAGTSGSTNPYANLNPGGNTSPTAVGNITIDDVREVSPTWATAGSGSWTASDPATGSWIGGSLPGGALGGASGASATFGNLETGNTTATLDQTWTLGTLEFNTTEWQYTISPGTGGTLVMDNSVNGTAPAQIDDNAGGDAASNYIEYLAVPIQLNSNTVVTVARSTDTLQIGGTASPLVSGTGSLTVAGTGLLVLYGPNTYSGGTVVNAGANLLVASDSSFPTKTSLQNNGNTTFAGSAVLSSLSGTGTLVVGNGTESNTVQLAAGSGLATVGGLVIAANATFDINNNHLIIDYGSGPDPIASIAAMLKTGYNGGAWNGLGGIISTAAQLNNATPGNLLYGLGYADSADKGNPAGLSSGTIEIKYTLLGDANLSGVVDGTDFGIVAANFNKGVSGWDQGDFNYNNVVDGTDFGFLAANFNKGAAGAAAWQALVNFAAANGLLADVPEPASTGLAVLGAVGFLSSRRRSRKE